MPHPGFLYLPIEMAVREFDSRLLIAMMAVERGMEVIFGQKWLMETNLPAMPPGMWISKTLYDVDAGPMRRARAAGHKVAAIDEEVPAFDEGSGELLWVDESAVRLCDRIFCLGAGHRDSMAAKWPDIADRLDLTGNPRWDYLRPDLRGLYDDVAAQYRKQHGRFILINTNSGNMNHRKTPEEVFKDHVDKGRIDPTSERDMEFWKDYANFELRNFQAIAPLTKRLVQTFPEHTVIIRPHPSERKDTYAEQLQGVERAKVIFEGAAAPWINASDLLIHTDCTTGIESYALGKPSICFETVPSVLHTQLLSGRLSFTVQSEDAVISEAQRIIGAGSGPELFPPHMRDIFLRFFSAQEGKLSAELVVEAAMKALGTSGARLDELTSPAWRPGLTYRRRWFSPKTRRVKFPPMDHEAVRARLQTLADTLGRPNVARFVPCGDNLIHLYNAKLQPAKPVGNIMSRAISRIARTG